MQGRRESEEEERGAVMTLHGEVILHDIILWSRARRASSLSLSLSSSISFSLFTRSFRRSRSKTLGAFCSPNPPPQTAAPSMQHSVSVSQSRSLCLSVSCRASGLVLVDEFWLQHDRYKHGKLCVPGSPLSTHTDTQFIYYSLLCNMWFRAQQFVKCWSSCTQTLFVNETSTINVKVSCLGFSRDNVSEAGRCKSRRHVARVFARALLKCAEWLLGPYAITRNTLANKCPRRTSSPPSL